MDYEKKYKEALERMKSWAKGEHPECFTEAQKAAAHQGENADVILAEMRGEIKPKFHEGDWIISNNKKYIYQVIEVKRGIYVIRDNADNRGYYVGIESADRDGRLWTIQDAKDGDVLATHAGAFIYNGKRGGSMCPGCYCGINTLGIFQTGVETHWTGKNVYPATKEQRDTLMIAMTDAGYTFDFEKKELKKLGQQEVTKMSDKVKDSAWSKEDEKMLDNCINALGDSSFDTYEIEEWLKAIKERIGG